MTQVVLYVNNKTLRFSREFVMKKIVHKELIYRTVENFANLVNLNFNIYLEIPASINVLYKHTRTLPFILVRNATMGIFFLIEFLKIVYL
jgi:hypothetical protein